MKKLLSLALVLTMVLTMSVTAFAQEITGESGSTVITYNANESYVVTIPDSMSVGTDANVSVKDVVLASGKELTVSVSSTQYNNGWKLKNGDDTIGYTLKIGDTDVANNGTVLTVKNGEAATKILVTAVPEDQKPKYSGSYTDTLTFTVAVKAPSYSYDATTASADELKTALTTALQAGETNIEITLSANADSTMFAAIRRAITNTEGVADGSISLTLKGVTTIPDHDDSWYNNNVIFGEMWKDENDDYLEEVEFVTQLKSVNLPDVLTIGADAFSGCENLTVLIAPKVQTIGEHAFCESGLTSVDLPEATTIGGFAFLGIKATEFHLPKVTVLGDQTLDLGDINNEVTIYLTSADEIEVDEDCFYQMVNWYNSLATKVNLVLNDNKQSQVSGNTWTTKDANGNEVSFTFKSITFEGTTN